MFYHNCAAIRRTDALSVQLNIMIVGCIHICMHTRTHTCPLLEAVLEDDEAIDAEIYMNKASAVINNAADDYALQLRYRVTYARVLDANRKFVEAAQRYYELSTTTNVNVRAVLPFCEHIAAMADALPCLCLRLPRPCHCHC